MLRHTNPAAMRVLCLTMLPDGGALTPALTALGYKPYTLRSSFQKGHASTHPIEWSLMLDRKKTMDKTMFGDCDCFIGPPAALLYDVILRECPSYTKVILVEEPDKARWAVNYDAYLVNLRKAMKRTSKNKISVSFRNMLEKMVVRGAEGEERSAGRAASSSSSAPSDGKGPSSVSNFSYASSRQRTTSSSPLNLENALKAEAAKAKRTLRDGPSASDGAGDRETTTTGASEEEEAPEEEEEIPMTPRAVALMRYEESVKMAIPSDRLLIYRYGDGWEPLCNFLERPVPSAPFPPYDDGLHVLSYLQERIYWAQTVMHVLVAITAALVLLNAWPYLGNLRRLVGDIYQDYQLAFGSDDDSRERRAKAPAERFEDEWRKRGGIVTVEQHK